MRHAYKLHSWHLSYFSGKLRAYMRFKGLDFEDQPVNAFNLLVRIPRKTGVQVMPVVQTREGDWLQDTTDIITRLEALHPTPSISPPAGLASVLSMLLEAWADEWWIPIAMHYRWTFAENYALFENEGGKALLPHAPTIVRNKAIAVAARLLRSYLPAVGVVPEQYGVMEDWTNATLDELETHFENSSYLFGARPTVADFALVGPMYGHLNRDPMPKRTLLDTRPHLQSWVNRVHGGVPASSASATESQLPETLTPILRAVLQEFLPMVWAGVDEVKRHVTKHNSRVGDSLPRSLATVRFPMGNAEFSRQAMPYTLWMMQRVQDHHRALGANEQRRVDDWFEGMNASSPGAWDLGPKLERRGLGTRLA